MWWMVIGGTLNILSYSAYSYVVVMTRRQDRTIQNKRAFARRRQLRHYTWVHHQSTSINQSINQFINQSIDQSTNQPVNQPTEQLLSASWCCHKYNHNRKKQITGLCSLLTNTNTSSSSCPPNSVATLLLSIIHSNAQNTIAPNQSDTARCRENAERKRKRNKKHKKTKHFRKKRGNRLNSWNQQPINNQSLVLQKRQPSQIFQFWRYVQENAFAKCGSTYSAANFTPRWGTKTVSSRHLIQTRIIAYVRRTRFAYVRKARV